MKKNLMTAAIVAATLILSISAFCQAGSGKTVVEGTGEATYTEGVPGGTVVGTVVINAVITAIDKDHRTITLKGPRGNEKTIEAGPEVKNFDQLKVGDNVKFTITEEVVVTMNEDKSAKAGGDITTVTVAPKGTLPEVVTVNTVQRVGTVKAKDEAKRTVSIVLEDGAEQTFPVRNDVNLKKVKTGDKVTFRVTESIAVKVERS